MGPVKDIGKILPLASLASFASLAKKPSQYLKVEFADGLLRIALDRPPVNVLNIALLRALAEVLEQAAADTEVRALLLTAQGDRYFSAGVEVAEHGAEDVGEMLAVFHEVARRLHDFPVPTIAALNGAALGGGLELALACDLRLMVEAAQLGQPEIRLGVFAPVAAILLPRLLPPGLAHEMLLGGRLLTAAEALQFGLVNRVFAAANFAEDVAGFVRPYLQFSRAAQIQNKRALSVALAMSGASRESFANTLAALEHQYLHELMATHDAPEGIAAFLEKRAPRWRHE